MDAVERAKSGHPGLPMGVASIACTLWTRHMRYNPRNPRWANRDRFVLSAGHGSMLLYSMLFLTGYDLPLEELQRFRQWGSRTPGHPEHGLTPGIETTTGPLGQGFGNGVGMAIAERMLAARFNRPGFALVDHHTYAIVSDGDLMEGVASEAASLAGHLGLGKLIYLYDDNRITIDGPTALAFSEDVARRFEAYHWHVQRVDGNDLPAVDAAIRAAQTELERPSLIVARTHIAHGAPTKQDTSAAHGAPLGAEEVRKTKERLGFPPDREFYTPDGVLEYFRLAQARGAALEAAWAERLAAYAVAHPDLAAEWQRRQARELPPDWDADLPRFSAAEGGMATRLASGRTLSALAGRLPELVGGSADLATSTEAALKGVSSFQRDAPEGRNLHFGVREHAMGAILSGLCLHGGLRPFGGTFLIFSDYMRPTIRLAAMMEQPVIYVFTHDSVGLGEDGPTHQPVEHLAALRAIPNLLLIRPGDANEAVEAWRVALERTDGPTALILSRQKLAVLDRERLAPAERLRLGAYVLADAEDGRPDLILMASGSEVQVIMAARDLLAQDGVRARVVSFPSWELFERQAPEYRAKVLPPTVRARIAVEAAVPFGWCRYVGDDGLTVGLARYGASAPFERILAEFGFTPEHVAEEARRLVRRLRSE
ncbi:MAG: transketolase [Chloroflexi bacterium]|nr:transketolase [Chloroflexota bacterium]